MTARHLGAETFPATAESVAEARRWMTDRLGPAHPACGDAVLLLSEAFTNSVLHSTGDKIEISASIDDHIVHVQVIDQGGDTLPHCVDDPNGESGRGLPIMRALARDWGWEPVEEGLKVWFDVAR
jgi:anti-sigma regulatory factor (Ser/Thr protein kinase)